MKAVVVAAFVLLSASAVFAQSMEDTVRLAYAKTMFANQVGIIENNLLWKKTAGFDLKQALRENDLSFQLSNFKEGSVMGNTSPLNSLITDPNGKPVLEMPVEWNDWTDKDGNKWSDFALKSIREGVGEGMPDIDKYVVGDLNTLASKLMKSSEQWTKFVTYNVAAKYKGATTSYRAAALFSDSGNAIIMEPYAKGVGQFATVPTSKVYPAVLLHALNKNPDVVAWVKANMASQENSRKGDLTCDLKTLVCLLPDPALVIALL